jgi:hypothetical protein
MTFDVGWNRRTDDGDRLRIQFKLVRDKAEWSAQAGRFNNHSPFVPQAADWQDLIEVLDRHYARGKVSKPDFDIVRKLAAAAADKAAGRRPG